MKLKEKFIGYCDHQYANREDNAENCVEIADDYAIEFAEWVIKRQTNYFESLIELLEIFKKEKGL